MDFQQEVFTRLSQNGSSTPLFMPDLTLWYQWNKSQNTLPAGYENKSLSQICEDLNCPSWIVSTPWKKKFDGIEVHRENSEKKKVTKYRTKAGELTESWTLGPDGDWWKTEYPVKTEEDIAVFAEVVEAMTYVPESQTAKETDTSIIRVDQLPQTPYSDMLLNHLGWSDGLMLMMGSEQDRLEELLAIMEENRQKLIQDLGDHLTSIVLAPDNLDGQYISPRVFENNLEESYQQTSDVLHSLDKKLTVHIGGFSKHMLALLAETGVDCLSGISGPPQSNANLAEARELTGPEITLWGGIPQDFLISARDQSDLDQSIKETLAMVKDDRRMIIGIADHTPVDADFERLKAVSQQINGSD